MVVTTFGMARTTSTQRITFAYTDEPGTWCDEVDPFNILTPCSVVA